MIFLESVSKLLLLLHVSSAIALIGAATHNGILAFQHMRGNFYRPDLQKTYTKIMVWLYPTTFALGLLLYPAFKHYVRDQYMDVHVPLATGFFEAKEHWVSIGAAILLFYYPLSRRINVRIRSAETLCYHVAGMTMTVIVWFVMFTGLTLVSIKSV
jgi:hypothetical protein